MATTKTDKTKKTSVTTIQLISKVNIDYVVPEPRTFSATAKLYFKQVSLPPLPYTPASWKKQSPAAVYACEKQWALITFNSKRYTDIYKNVQITVYFNGRAQEQKKPGEHGPVSPAQPKKPSQTIITSKNRNTGYSDNNNINKKYPPVKR